MVRELFGNKLVGAVPFCGECPLKINFDQPIKWVESQKLAEIKWLPVLHTGEIPHGTKTSFSALMSFLSRILVTQTEGKNQGLVNFCREASHN